MRMRCGLSGFTKRRIASSGSRLFLSSQEAWRSARRESSPRSNRKAKSNRRSFGCAPLRRGASLRMTARDNRARYTGESPFHVRRRRRVMASTLLPSTPLESRPGRFGLYGGRYVPETLMAALLELEHEYEVAKADTAFQAELNLLQIGRAS